MSPFDIIYSWQALLVMVVASALTEFVKRTINIFLGMKEDADGDGKLTAWEKLGREMRADAVWINNLVLPGIVVGFGAAVACVIPARPEILLDYAAKHAPGGHAYLLYAAWGAACGQFADYTFMRLKNTIMDFASKRKANESNEG